MELRANQIRPTEIGIKFFKQKNPVPSIIVAPTAFGKSILIAKIAESISDNVIILQPSKELLEQNINKYIAIGGQHAAIYSASFNSRSINKVTYATIGSIKNLGSTFRELGFTKMICDEVHLFPRESDSMIGKFLKDSGITHVLGLTATPLKLQQNRSLDGESFSKLVMLTSKSKKGNFFKDIISVSQISEIVEMGFWSKLEYEQFDIDETGLVYNSSKAEFTEESIKAVYNYNNTEEIMSKRMEQLIDRKSIIVFVPSVADATRLSEQTPNSVAIYADMKSHDRAKAIKDFRSGKIRVIFNVNILSVGFDHPELDCIIMARSTASLAWYYQALGRGTRISPYKQDCLIIDFSGNVNRFGKIEKLYYKKENIWKLYGEGGKLLTGCAVHTIGNHTEESEALKEKAKNLPIFTFGKYRGREVSEVFETDKPYLDWMLRTFDWNKYNKHIKAEIVKLSERVKVA